MNHLSSFILPVIILWLVFRFYIRTLNKLKRYEVVIEESKKNVDVALAKRYDTISQMINVAKSYARYEKNTFTELAKSRASHSIEDFNTTIKNQDQTIDKIFALAEAYPELRSSDEFLKLQNEIDDENEQLAAAKRIVNNNISMLNQEVVSFPNSIVASMNGIKQLEFLSEDNLENKKSIDSFDYEI